MSRRNKNYKNFRGSAFSRIFPRKSAAMQPRSAVKSQPVLDNMESVDTLSTAIVTSPTSTRYNIDNRLNEGGDEKSILQPGSSNPRGNLPWKR